VGAGHHRIILNFSGVERLSSWAVSFVAESLRRCARASQGTLKVCGLREEVAAIFAVTGSAREIAIYPDETAAVDSPWPHQSDLLPLPIEIFSALTRAANAPPIDESEDFIADDFDPRFTVSIEEPPVMIGVWLIPKTGSSKGRAIAVESPRFVIGRDPECNLRPDSPAVSRIHSAIEIDEDQVFLRDLGSANGTTHNGKILRNERAELSDGDTIELGPVAFTVALGSTMARPAAMDDLVMTWLRDPDADDAIPLLQPPTEEFPTLTTTSGTLSFKHELIQDIVVLTPITADLDGDLALNMLRTELQSLYDRMLPRRVVVNLTHVAHLSARAIGILLAHHLKLDREGGALRVCQAHARVGAVLEQVHLGMIVECFPTLEDAVLEVWPKMVEETAV
jgi:anti-anti-sigma factor